MDEKLREMARKEIFELVTLLDSKIDSCEEVFRNAKFNQGLEAEAAGVRNVILIRMLRNFSRLAQFLGERVNIDHENAQFYLSQLRTLTEINVKLIYLLSIEMVDAARVVICSDLVSLKKISTKDYFEYFEESRKLYPKLLFDLEYLPKTPNDFSKSKLKKLQKIHDVSLLFPEFRGLINGAFIKKTTPFVEQFMVGKLEEVFQFAWVSFSEHVHGNHLFNEAQGSESFWIDTNMFVLLGTVIEVSDRNILDNEKSADLRIRFKKTSEVGGLVINAWKRQRGKIETVTI